MPKGPKPRDPMERFWEKVDQTGDCWEWNDYIRPSGYGQFYAARRIHLAHRWIWEQTNGPIPEGLFVCHKCDNRKCVRPDHLFIGTNADNVRDMVRKGRVARGRTVPNAKLSAEIVARIRIEYARGIVTQEALAERYGVTRMVISRALRGVDWAWVGGPLAESNPKPMAKISADEVRAMREKYAAGGKTITEIAAEHGQHYLNTWQILHRVTWDDVD